MNPSDIQLSSAAKDQGVIPNFCLLPNVFLVLLMSELLALLATVTAYKVDQSLWQQLGYNSLFICWVALCSAAVFCACRGWLNQLSVARVTLFCSLSVALVTCISSLLAISLFYGQSINVSAIAQQQFLLKNLIAAMLVTLILMRYLVLRQQVIQGLLAEGEAKFQSLQARIQPHFLFNTLNTIASLIALDANKAERTVEHLAQLMRSSLRRNPDLQPLAHEVEICKHYLAIEQQRLADKLVIDWQIEDSELLNALIPSFTLQPLIENALYHGIQRLSKGGTVTIKIFKQSEQLYLVVVNPMPATSATAGNQIAHKNIRQRLAIRFGDSASLETEAIDQHYQAQLRLPLTSQTELEDAQQTSEGLSH